MKNIANYTNHPTYNPITPIIDVAYYKNSNSFRSAHDAICYICSQDFDYLANSIKDITDLTDAELVDYNLAETHNTILKKVNDVWGALSENITTKYSKEEVATKIFEMADHCAIDTYIDMLFEDNITELWQ